MNRIENKAKNKKDFMRSLASMYKVSAKPILKLAKKFGEKNGSKDFACNLLMPYSMAVEEESNCYVTYDLYPKKAEELQAPYVPRKCQKGLPESCKV